MRGLVRTIQERAAVNPLSDIKPTLQQQLVIMGGRYVELAKVGFMV